MLMQFSVTHVDNKTHCARYMEHVCSSPTRAFIKHPSPQTRIYDTSVKASEESEASAQPSLNILPYCWREGGGGVQKLRN